MPQRSSTAFLIDYYDGDYQLGLMRGAEDASIACDQNLIVAVGRWLNSPNPIDAVQNDVFRHLNHPGVSAIAVVAGCLSHYVSLDEMRGFCESFSPLPVVSISVQVPGTPSLVIDNRRGQRRIVDHLFDVHGCKRVAYIRGPITSFEAEQRLAGYRDSLENHGVEFNPELVVVGDFWINSGTKAMASLLDSGIRFDALAAANDYMALGAMDELKLRAIAVPKDMLVVGFDDIPSARMSSPSLTTVRQPLQEIGKRAFELLQECREGRDVDLLHAFDVELVRRQSCGCGLRMGEIDSINPPQHLEPLTITELTSRRPLLQRRLSDSVSVNTATWPPAINGLIAALSDELSGQRGRFLSVLGDTLDRFKTKPESLDQFYNVIAALRIEFRHRVLPERSPIALDDLWHSAILLIGEWISRVQLRVAFEQERLNDSLRSCVERISSALTHASLGEAVDAVIPKTLIKSACFSLYSGEDRNQLQVFSAMASTDGSALRGRKYSPEVLAPEGFFPQDRRSTFILMPLSHGGTLFGQALFESGEHRSVYSMLREQIGSALKAAELHRAVVDETSRRERAERERLERETEIAQQIQTAILPVNFSVPGLEIVATMKPATSVGGDYYDVIPITDGCFIGIGDVSGHGLLAGMIMLMVQSMIAAAIRLDEQLTPSDLLPPINRAMYDNVRNRLRGTDHVTLTLIKYHRDGRLLLAGAHEDALLYRPSTRHCRRIVSSGFWLAAIADVTDMTSNIEVQLESGDFLILYTDGVTEAMNESHEQFGLQRLIATIEQYADQEPKQLSESILSACLGWSSTQIDDVSLVVAKYQGQ